MFREALGGILYSQNHRRLKWDMAKWAFHDVGPDLLRDKHSTEGCRVHSITERVALAVEAQEGFGRVEFGVLGGEGVLCGRAAWGQGLRSNPTLERGKVRECCPRLHGILGDGAKL